jgi:hypothetical protein
VADERIPPPRGGAEIAASAEEAKRRLRAEVERARSGVEELLAGESRRIDRDAAAALEATEERLRGAAEHRIDLEIERLRAEDERRRVEMEETLRALRAQGSTIELQAAAGAEEVAVRVAAERINEVRLRLDQEAKRRERALTEKLRGEAAEREDAALEQLEERVDALRAHLEDAARAEAAKVVRKEAKRRVRKAEKRLGRVIDARIAAAEATLEEQLHQQVSAAEEEMRELLLAKAEELRAAAERGDGAARLREEVAELQAEALRVLDRLLAALRSIGK